jgi:hypothetical protein
VDGLQLGKLGQGLVRSHQQPRTAVHHDVGHLARRLGGAEHRGIQAGLPGRQDQGQDLDPVFKHHREAVARLQALGMEPLRHAQSALRHLAGSMKGTGLGHDQHHMVGSRCRPAEKILQDCHPLLLGASPWQRQVAQCEMNVL